MSEYFSFMGGTARRSYPKESYRIIHRTRRHLYCVNIQDLTDRKVYKFSRLYVWWAGVPMSVSWILGLMGNTNYNQMGCSLFGSTRTLTEYHAYLFKWLEQDYWKTLKTYSKPVELTDWWPDLWSTLTPEQEEEIIKELRSLKQ